MGVKIGQIHSQPPETTCQRCCLFCRITFGHVLSLVDDSSSSLSADLQPSSETTHLLHFIVHTCRQARCGHIVYCLCFCLFVCCFVKLRNYPPTIKASNFVRWFIGVLGRESHISENFAPQKRLNNPTAHNDHGEVGVWGRKTLSGGLGAER